MSTNGSLDFLVEKQVEIVWMDGVKRISETYKVGGVVGRTHLEVWKMNRNEKLKTIPFAGFDMGIVQIKYLRGQVVFHNPHAEAAYTNGNSLTNQEKKELAEKEEWKV